MMKGKKGKYLALLIIFSAGTFLSVLFFYFSYRWEKIKIKAVFDDAAEYHFKYIEDAVQYNIAALNSFGDLYAASEKIARDEFDVFAQGIFLRQPYIYEFRWLPQVLAQQRQTFEASAVKEGLSDFTIKEINKEGHFVRAGERQEYFPVYYISQVSGAKHGYVQIFGLDAASIPERWQAMQHARDSAGPAIVMESKLYGETQINSASRIYLPIYRRNLPHNTIEERRDNLSGFVVLLYRMDDLVKVALKDVPDAGVDISIYADSPQEKKLIYFHPSRLRGAPKDIEVSLEEAKNPRGLSWSRPLAIADQQWLVSCTPCPQFLAIHKVILPWVTLFIGLILTLLLTLYLKNIINRENAIALLVEQRTEQLCRTEEKYRVLYESSSDAIMTIVPPNWNFASGNPAAVRLFGAKDEQEFISKGPSELSPERQPDGAFSPVKVRMMIDTAMEKGSHFFDWQHRKISGEEFSSTVLLSRVESEGRVFLQATVRDITEHRRIDEEKKRMLTQQQDINILQQALLAPDALEDKLTKVTDGIVRIFNADFCRIWVIRPGDLCEKGCVHAAAKEGPHVCRFRDKCLHLLASSGRYTHIDGNHRRVPFDCYKIGRIASDKEHKFLTNDVINDPWVHNHQWARELGLVSFAGYQLKVPGGETMGVLALFAKHPILPVEDALLDSLVSATGFIIQQASAEEKIKDANREWFDTFNSISDFVFILDKDSTLTKVNKTFLDTLHLKEKDIIGRKCYEIVHGASTFWSNCPHQKTIRDNKPHTEIVEDPRLGLPLLVSTSPIFDNEGKFLGSVHIAKDITQIKKAEAELRKAIEMKSNFASTVSHELRTPLAAIKEGISLVLDGTSGEINKEQNEFLNIAKKNVDRLGRLINDILDFQKLESGKMVFNMQSNDINGVIKEVRDTMLSITQQKGLDFTFELDEGLPHAQFDRDRIIQVLTNLVNNAIKFTEKGSICIQAGRRNNFIMVSVRDSGIGIKSEDIPRIFVRFEQLDAGMTRKTGGTGLGLSICKEIIEKHSGKIWVESKFGEGSTFNFTLPIA